MQLPNTQIELAASTEESRYTLRAVKFDVEGKRIMATDGHILAIVPCEPAEGDHSSLIPLDAMKAIRTMERASKHVPVQVTTNGKITAKGGGGTSEFEAMEGQFPNVDMVVPKDGAWTLTIGLDAELLYKLAKAITPKGEGLIVKLQIKDGQSSVKVTTSKLEGAIGVIMPCRV